MKLIVAALVAIGITAVAAGQAQPADANSGMSVHPVHAASARPTSAGCHRTPSPAAAYVPGHALQAVQFVSTSTGWAVGANRVLGTTDGGAHWVVQRSAAKAGYSEIDAIDSDHAWVVGRHQLIVTGDGGASWRRLPEPCPVISSVHFVSPADGFAVAGGRLLRTPDGGSRWSRMHAPAMVQSVCFTDAQRGWLGAHGQIYRTVTGGTKWAVATSARPRQRQAIGEVQCAGVDAGWAEVDGPGAAMNQKRHVGYHLSDSGAQPIFAEQYFPHPGVHVKRNSPGAEPAAFSAIDPSTAVFVDWCSPCGHGTAPVAIATHNGTTLDRVGRVGRLNQAFGVSFASTTDGWAVGGRYHYAAHRTTWKIEHTNDGGKHWTTQYVE